jgi:L-ascorbate metabolism protein UlaG (beta-lactamase superfamily)
MQIQLLRHATLFLMMNGSRILVDPMLGPAGSMDPIQNAPNPRRIPLVDLPLVRTALGTLLNQVDIVLVTHTHRDHWDSAAIHLIPKSTPVLCQPQDEWRILADGFTQVWPITATFEWHDIHFTRTEGQHGTGDIGRKMAPVSGFALQAETEPCLYLAGDTIWCAEVIAVLNQSQPDITIVNAGAAQFLTGGPITMTAEDVIQVCKANPGGKVIAVHMEAVNHCLLSRSELRSRIEGEGIMDRVFIPEDGEQMEF